MELSRLFLLCLPAVWVLAAASAVADVPAARSPGCTTRCGDIDVPYPYGLEPRCAIHRGFQLNCTTVRGATKLFHGTMEVIKISVQDSKAWLKTYISRQCYNQTTNRMLYNNAWMNISGTPYVLSADDNKVIVLGCRSLAYMLSDTYIIGCLSTCDDVRSLKNGSCSGAGCCQVDLPKGVQYYQGFFNSLYNTTQIWRSTPCSYVTVMESAAFSFSTAYLTSTVFYDTDHARIPIVMEWAIKENTTCEEAKVDKKTPYACVSNNSNCITNNAGYLCRCSNGYRGNPYIVDGCTDIDECLDNVTYPCPGICENTPGSFTCSCPRGKSMINGVCVKNPKSIWMAPVVGGSIGLVVLVVAITCAYLIRERRKLHRIKQKYFRQHGGLLLFEEMKSQQGVPFKIFSEEELQQATNRFDEQVVIGHGGHGKVYKGVLKSDVEVAVKRCVTIDEQQKKEFGREMLILSQINHKNIVKLLGCCLEVEVPVLVYEFIPNGTLFHLIHGNHSRHISLDTRLRIACESAEALAYLHSCASPPILHGDVKSTNILLDGDYAAKVSDFGASILAPSDKSQFVTLVQGTCGYLDPEYMQTCQLTDKSDVYSFGVVLLELLTRKKAFNLQGPEHEKSLSMAFLSAMKENKLEDILDDQIKNNENVEFLEEIAELARQCLEMCGVNRPSMKEVADKLDRLRKVMQHPWAHKDPEELDSLLGEPSLVSSGVTGAPSTGNFSITKKVAMGLESGR
ncbi:putative wall-associated receptor kinase-like 16 [Phragmites australis]|uniref:putative wall-associated receptor kinase-like 16 n=1 Tax=Phragmites australis TaxID=29695 RepID=UPI002D795ACC|nr:putative wall-associated receptor kinase-like 16 [Phragmites australis]